MENNVFSKLVEERESDGYVESSAEYILPDYDPDVRKLLYTYCDVKPAGKFFADEQVDFSGIVEYRCIYADKDGELSALSFTSDYEYSVSLAGGAIDADSIPWVQNYQIRVLGPRKISAKASISCENVYTRERDSVGEAICGGDDIELEKRKVKCGRLKRVESEERELAEVIATLDGVSLDEVKVLYGAVERGECEISRDGGEGKCKSDLRVKIVYRDPDGQMIPIEGSLSGEGAIPLEGITEDANIICIPHVLSESFECVPTEDGVNIVANLIVKWDATCIYNDEHSVVRDGYSTDFALDTKYSSIDLVSFSAPCRERVTSEGDFTPDRGEFGKIKEVIVADARARISEKRIEDGSLYVGVDFKVQGVISCINSDGATVYAPLKISENISKKVNFSGKNCAYKGAIVRMYDTNISQKIDGDDIRYTLFADLDVIPCEEACVQVLLAAERREEEKIERASGRVTVYYTEPHDTLFSVAKKYHIATSRLLESNDIVSEVMGGEDVLVLPRRLKIY